MSQTGNCFSDSPSSTCSRLTWIPNSTSAKYEVRISRRLGLTGISSLVGVQSLKVPRVQIIWLCSSSCGVLIFFGTCNSSPNTPRRVLNTTYCLDVCLHITLSQMVGRTSQRTDMLDSCMQAKQSVIESRIGSWLCHGSQVGSVSGWPIPSLSALSPCHHFL